MTAESHFIYCHFKNLPVYNQVLVKQSHSSKTATITK